MSSETSGVEAQVTIALGPKSEFADLVTSFNEAAQVIQSRDTSLIHNGALPGGSPLAIRRFSDDLYIISGYELADPSVSEVSKRIQKYQQNPLPEASRPGTYTVLAFQNGPVLGQANGLTMESLLAVVADRLESFQASEYACEENGMAANHIQLALELLRGRAARRQSEVRCYIDAQSTDMT